MGRKVLLAVSAPDFILFQSVAVTKQKRERYLSVSLSPSNTGHPGYICGTRIMRPNGLVS